MSDATAFVLIAASVTLAISVVGGVPGRTPACNRGESDRGSDVAGVNTAVVLAGIGLVIIVDPSTIGSFLAAGLFVAKVVGTVVLLVGFAVLLLVCAAVVTAWRIKSRLRTEARQSRST